LNQAKVRRELGTWWRAALVSTLVTGVELGLVPLLTKVIPAWATFALVQVLANLGTFLLYKYWAFDAGKHGNIAHQVLKQAVVFGGSWVLNTAIPSWLHYRAGMRPLYAFALSNVFVYLGWNYPLNRIWVFRRAVDADEPAPLSSSPNGRRREEGRRED
jgi:putative flippase GtrA